MVHSKEEILLKTWHLRERYNFIKNKNFKNHTNQNRTKTFQNKKLWWVKQPERRVKERNLSQKFSWTPEKMVAAVNEITSPYVSQRVSEKKQEMNNSSYCFTIVVDHQEWETQKDVRRVDNKFSL